MLRSLAASFAATYFLQCTYAVPPPARFGPIMEGNFPDPAIIKVDDTYYTFSTNSGGANVPIAKSNDLHSMTLVTDHSGKPQDAMHALPAWVDPEHPNIWAPDVIQLANGKFALYFSGSSKKDFHKHCIGAATSDRVTGPYLPSDDYLYCDLSKGGAIDPAGFIDSDGKVYVVYKIDGNSLGGGGSCGNADESHSTPIMLQQISANDGTTPIGDPKPILDRGQFDGPLIEAPSLVRQAGGLYVLFFSSNCYNTVYYDTSYATSSKIGGPYTKAKKPLLVTGTLGLTSPGGADLLEDGETMVFHADADRSGNAHVRQMYSIGVKIDEGSGTVSLNES